MKIITFLLILTTLVLSGQNTDTLSIHFQTNAYKISGAQAAQIKRFVSGLSADTKLMLSGHTDDVGEAASNELLSYRREKAVLDILKANGIDSSQIAHQHFGENKPFKPNTSNENRSLNRRVDLIRYKTNFLSVQAVIPATINKEAVNKAGNGGNNAGGRNTVIQKNGIILNYYPGTLPEEVETSLRRGENMFQLTENTAQMQTENMLTMTTDGGLLSSLAVFCPPRINNCRLDSPVVIKVPINNPYHCPLSKIRFYNSTIQDGKKLWEEQNEKMYPEMIDGKQFISVKLTNLCSCVNFDYKAELPCFPIDTVLVKFPRPESFNFEITCSLLNSVYVPKLKDERTIFVLVPKGKLRDVFIDGALDINEKKYKLRKVSLTKIPYSGRKKAYVLTKKRLKKYRA